MNELERFRAILAAAKEENKRLHDEVERLTAEERAIHVIQQEAVHKHNAMNGVMQGLYSIVGDLEKQAAKEKGDG